MKHDPHDTSWAPRTGDVLDGRYRLEEIVDAGGMGLVMRAEHVRMRRPVAVKLLHPDIALDSDYRARFEREVELATTIDHPNVVLCHDFGETESGVMFLVMELLDGDSLKQLLRREGRMSTGRTLQLARQLLDGMAAAHMVDVIHRDLKPGNIWIGTDHRGRPLVKILDFGLAKNLADEDVSLTQTGKVFGTAAYLAPEALVVQETTKSGDVYGLGLIILEMLLGRKVFSGSSMAQAFLQQLMLPARVPRRIWDTPLGSLIASTLEKHPEDRPPDAEALYEMLLEAGEIEDFRLEPDEIPPRPDKSLAPSLLNDLGAGRYRDLETLRSLPRPEPYDRSAPPLDTKKTERFVLDRISESSDQLRARTKDGKQTTPRLGHKLSTDQMPTIERREVRPDPDQVPTLQRPEVKPMADSSSEKPTVPMTPVAPEASADPTTTGHADQTLEEPDARPPAESAAGADESPAPAPRGTDDVRRTVLYAVTGSLMGLAATVLFLVFVALDETTKDAPIELTPAENAATSDPGPSGTAEEPKQPIAAPPPVKQLPPDEAENGDEPEDGDDPGNASRGVAEREPSHVEAKREDARAESDPRAGDERDERSPPASGEPDAHKRRVVDDALDGLLDEAPPRRTEPEPIGTAKTDRKRDVDETLDSLLRSQ